MGKVAICYFSGTGNSLHAARELAKRLPEAELVPVMGRLNQQEIEIGAESVGFVFPLHAFSFPLPMKEFFRKLRLPSASYLFAVATRGGSPCRVFQDIDGLIKANRKKLDAAFFIDMPGNYPLLAMATPQQIAEMASALPAQLDAITAAVNKREAMHGKDPHANAMMENVVYPPLKWIAHVTRYGGMEKKWYADEKCTGCGTCQQVCLSGKIAMKDKKPAWQKDVRCTFCFACINYCPARAVQLKGTKTAEKGRYVHPQASAGDIASQKL